jgi:hypothetical protein
MWVLGFRKKTDKEAGKTSLVKSASDIQTIFSQIDPQLAEVFLENICSPYEIDQQIEEQPDKRRFLSQSKPEKGFVFVRPLSSRNECVSFILI